MSATERVKMVDYYLWNTCRVQGFGFTRTTICTAIIIILLTKILTVLNF